MDEHAAGGDAHHDQHRRGPFHQAAPTGALGRTNRGEGRRISLRWAACGRSGAVPLIPTLATGDIGDGMVATVCRFNGGGSRGVNDAETNGAGRSTRGERGGASNVFT